MTDTSSAIPVVRATPEDTAPTPAEVGDVSRPQPGRVSPADVVLSETADGWTLSFASSAAVREALTAALAAALDDTRAGTGTSTHRVSVLVRPNLVPGGPFDALLTNVGNS